MNNLTAFLIGVSLTAWIAWGIGESNKTKPFVPSTPPAVACPDTVRVVIREGLDMFGFAHADTTTTVLRCRQEGIGF